VVLFQGCSIVSGFQISYSNKLYAINNSGSKITLAEAMTKSKSGELMEEETDERSNIKSYEVATCSSD